MPQNFTNLAAKAIRESPVRFRPGLFALALSRCEVGQAGSRNAGTRSPECLLHPEVVAWPLRRTPARRHFYFNAMKISVNLQLDKITRGLENLTKGQASYAVAAALTDTAAAVQAAEVHEIRDSFDRPTPATLDSIYVRPATKSKLEATVGIKDFMGKGNPAVKWLQAEIEGGQRHTKRFERALQASGILPQGYAIVPGAAADLDEYGNIRPSLIVQLLSYFKAFPEMGYRMNMSDKRKAALAKGNKKKGQRGVAYFVSRGNWLHAGIWARYTFAHGSAVKPILMFVRTASYEKRFDFFYAAEKTIEAQFPLRLKKRWEEAWVDAWAAGGR